ncbi:MAG: DUF6452 family protein [Pricia sp.]
MRKFRIPLIILFGILAFSACEKDDICIDADTPRLVIQFYDIEDPTELKDVQNLVVKGLDDMGVREDSIPNIALDSIVIPLRPSETSTSFTLKRVNSISDINVDTITFSYEAKEIFASRACGYVVNYDNLEAALTGTNPDSLWIQGITVDSTFIENSAATHVRIFH